MQKNKIVTYHDNVKARKPTLTRISGTLWCFPPLVFIHTHIFENSKNMSLMSWRNRTTMPILWYLSLKTKEYNLYKGQT